MLIIPALDCTIIQLNPYIRCSFAFAECIVYIVRSPNFRNFQTSDSVTVFEYALCKSNPANDISWAFTIIALVYRGYRRISA
jgi:hypothetical protein